MIQRYTPPLCANSNVRALPQFTVAMDLFSDHLPCDAGQLRRVYLRLALRYHPDKSPEGKRSLATELFQAIAAAYEELLNSIEGDAAETGIRTRVKSPVAAAAELGDLDELRRLLEELPARANECDDLGVYPLMFAAAGGCTAGAELLLEFKADIHARNPIGWSVLLYASLGDHVAMVCWLVKQGAWVRSHELVLTAYTGNSESLAALLDLFEGSAAEVRSNESKKTLLHLAVEGMCFLKRSAQKHAACVDALLQHQVPVDFAEPAYGRTCLQNYLDDVRWKARQFQASSAHMYVVEQLCKHGASMSLEDFKGNSAMSIAAAQGLDRVREMLFMYA